LLWPPSPLLALRLLYSSPCLVHHNIVVLLAHIVVSMLGHIVVVVLLAK
jgi:hypothetical protein